jgi:ABC-type phosphate/phosphonate transport system permease subunit
VGLVAKMALPAVHPIWRAIVVLGLFGAMYLGSALALGVSEARQALGRVRRLLGR